MTPEQARRQYDAAGRLVYNFLTEHSEAAVDLARAMSAHLPHDAGVRLVSAWERLIVELRANYTEGRRLWNVTVNDGNREVPAPSSRVEAARLMKVTALLARDALNELRQRSESVPALLRAWNRAGLGPVARALSRSAEFVFEDVPAAVGTSAAWMLVAIGLVAAMVLK
ncbi:MAG: hypothetical protein GY953_46960 [bacterium]|nr:hypothetical protein [bacterium]